ncbi:diacylglycerol kinase family lipid kinase [Herbivorax sp. ANBcel31]|uniref:diacylglycerol/lipid kinase family protein n=1 Tax=Herbivorax sp. ANBcel31 TaxID=3069754 RepID=UPI0027B38E04|nr:diacylglycerol kinase family protein [Herbivorax sp. ANBcel31]MDQ2087431.1 diacylglycerol kinase family lipid kinase [Herbivorax sp. ANBcel31]
MKHVFIVNPNAGKEKYKDFIVCAKRLKNDYDINLEITTKPEEIGVVIDKYKNLDDFRLYSVGGDGTINGIINCILSKKMNKKIPLGIVPTGTANDVSRYIYNEESWNYKKNLPLLLNGKEKKVDVGKVNERFFLNISSIGFDANAAKEAYRFKKLRFFPSSLSYYAGVIVALLKKRPLHFKILIDDKSYSHKYLFVVIANGRKYGGGVTPTPEALIDDGIFDICMVKDVSRLNALRILPVYIKGNHTGLSMINMVKCKKISIESAVDVELNVDGDIYTIRKADFEIIPGALKIIVPQK